MDIKKDNSQQPTGSQADNVNTPNTQNGGEDIDMVPLYRKKRVIIAFLFLVIAVVLSVWYWYMNMRNYVSTDDSYIDANRISISSKILGRIKLLAVDEGDTVTKGQVVIQLDDTELQAQLEQAKASLILSQERITLAQVNLDRAKDDFQRAELQYKKAVITKEQFVHTQKTLEGTQAEYGIAAAQVEVSRSQVKIVASQLQNMQISIPFDGVVVKRWVMADEVVQPGQPILSVYDLNNVWVTSNLEETKLGPVKTGDPVEINDFKFLESTAASIASHTKV